ncbi:hypothetical protein KIW84_057969 [Lathyrus oleraceus]|uniref:Uncharacterized protein n=1 Tax=Pisum sativum TaxID=3888 RepID=A0A9D5AIV0_PEA|nr:hypothetical protein KIW84_057969 [Pisum sativum]
MTNNNNTRASLAHSYTESNDGEQPQPESGGGRGNREDVREAVKETYSNIQNSSQTFGLKSKLWHAKQEDCVLFLKRQENDCVFMFLARLNKDLDGVRGRVLGKIPLPTLRETFAEIRREDGRQGTMIGKTPRNSEYAGLAMATRNLDKGKRLDKVPWCDHYKREWHTCEICWKLKGKPSNCKKKCGCAF